MKTRLVLADDHKLFLEGLRALLAHEPDFEIVGEAGNGHQALALARELEPDLLLMDLSMPDCDGIEATRRIVAHNPAACVLVLTAHSDRRRTLTAIEAGAVGYLVKDVEPSHLLDAIRSAARGDSPLDPRAARALVSAISKAEQEPALSSREIEIVALVASGLKRTRSFRVSRTRVRLQS